MNILILNWRDIKNPAGGGAEILTQEIAKRWVKQGHTVIQFSSMFRNAKTQETIDGVRFIRKGQWWNVHFFAFIYYLFVIKDRTDIVIDEVHWFPFFSALYAPKKTIAFVCEVANNMFYNIFPYPVALGWRVIEKIYLNLYKNVPTMAISKSTRDDLIKEGHSSSNIIVLPMGLTTPSKIRHFPKEKKPTFIYVARLNKQKGIFDTIKAFALIKKDVSSAKLWIVGSSNEAILQKVKKEIAASDLTSSVIFFGFVTQEKKFELLSRAHLLISASVQEGWGLTVPEAGLTKTPSVVYNTQGFRDIIENRKDGMLVDPNPTSLAKAVVEVLQENKLYKNLQLAAEKKAKHYSWETTASIATKFLELV